MSGGTVVWPIYALFTGNIVSYVGNTLTLLAVPWFVLQTTGSVAQAGIVGFFSLLSTIVSTALRTVLVERLAINRTRVRCDLLTRCPIPLRPLLSTTFG